MQKQILHEFQTLEQFLISVTTILEMTGIINTHQIPDKKTWVDYYNKGICAYDACYMEFGKDFEKGLCNLKNKQSMNPIF